MSGEAFVSLWGRLRLPWPQTRKVLAFCLFEATFYLAYQFGMTFSQTTSAPFWFPDSILLCALLLSPRRYWILFLLAPLPIRLFSSVSADIPLWFLLATYAIDSGKAILSATLLRRFLRNPLRFETLREFAIYAVIAIALVPAAAACLGASARQVLGHAFVPAWIEWFGGNALTQVIVTPVILYWLVGSPWRQRPVSTARRLEAVCVAAGLGLTAWLAFAGAERSEDFARWQYYAPIPFMFWAAVRFGMFGATGTIAILAFVVVEAALSRQAVFAGKSPDEVALMLQEFLFLRAVPLYLIGVLLDQMKRAESSLRESEQRYREVIDSQTDLVCRFLLDGTLTFVNVAYCRYFGRSREQLIGTSFFELIPEDAHEATRAQLQLAVSQQRALTYEHEVNLPSGKHAWQQWTDHPIFDANGLLKEFQSIGHDISDRKRAEEALQNLTHAGRLVTVGQLTAMIAHEITQPLSAMLSNAQAAARLVRSKSRRPVPELREMIDDICKNNLRAAEAVDRIRNLSRNQSISLQPLDINRTLQDVLRLMNGDADRRKVRILLKLDSRLPCVLGDRIHLQQVILNVVFNAMDAMSKCSPATRVITIQTGTSVRAAEAGVEIAIADCGPGIPAHQLAHIFHSFFTTKPDGMGMGLAIARSIIEAHGGRIWAESRLGEGTVFRFSLRVADTAEIPALRHRATSTALTSNASTIT